MSMDCKELRALLPISLDGELGAQSEALVAAHLDSCANCRDYRRRQGALWAAIRSSATYHRAPANLRDRVNNALPAVDTSDVRAGRKSAYGWRFVWRVLNGAGLATAACAVLVLTVVMPLRPSADERLGDEVVASHARALLTQHVMDVTSSDQHTVKPWFNGKLDFSPPVRDFTEQGYPLAGGRLDYIDHRAVAVLVYRRRQHLIDVFIWPENHKTISPRTIQGYHLAGNTASDMSFLAVSDLDPVELKQFVEML